MLGGHYDTATENRKVAVASTAAEWQNPNGNVRTLLGNTIENKIGVAVGSCVIRESLASRSLGRKHSHAVGFNAGVDIRL